MVTPVYNFTYQYDTQYIPEFIWIDHQIKLLPSDHNATRNWGRLEKVYNEWRNLQKASKRGGTTQKSKEKTFVKSLEDTFNIAHASS